MPEQMNAGFFRMKSSERTRAFVQRLVASAEQRETWKHFQPDDMTDQHYFNMLLANGAEAAGLSFSTLNPDLYLNGWNLKSNMSWDYSGESGGTWTRQYNIQTGPGNCAVGISGIVRNGVAEIWFTDAAPGFANDLYKVVDTGPTASPVLVAAQPADSDYRGVAVVGSVVVTTPGGCGSARLDVTGSGLLGTTISSKVRGATSWSSPSATRTQRVLAEGESKVRLRRKSGCSPPSTGSQWSVMRTPLAS